MDVLIRESGVYGFGPYRLDPVRRTLTRGGESVVLTARLFDTLLYLVENHDRLVEKTELERAVWRGRSMEAGNVAKAVSSLRKALQADEGGETVIVTVAGRGYRFGLPVVFEACSYAPAPIPTDAAPDITSVASAPSTPPAVETPLPRRRGLVIGAALVLAAVAACVLGLRAGGGLMRPPAFAPPRLSVAVMPLTTLGDDPHGSILAYNISEDLAGELRHDIPGIVVEDPEKSAGLSARPFGEIGRALGVRYVLQGTLSAAGGRIDVDVRLFDTVGLQEIWHYAYPAVTATPWATEASIVRGIASALNVTLLDAEVARAARERPNNPDALDLFYAARIIMDRADTLDQLTDAQHKFERAIAAAPDFVEALADLGWLLVQKPLRYNDPEDQRDLEEAGQVIPRAVRLDKTNPMARSASGWLLSIEGRCAEATAVFDVVLATDPDFVPALSGRSDCAWRNGDPERVLADLTTMLRLDPHARDAKHTSRRAGIAALFAGHYQAARDFLLQWEAQDLDLPADTDAFSPMEAGRLYLIAAYALLGDMPEAQRRYHAFTAIWHHRSVWREISFFSRNMMRMPRLAQVERALQDAGMPLFSDEHADDGVKPAAERLRGADFTPTPLTIPGGETIDTAMLQTLLARQPAPLVVEVGKWREVLPGALMLTDEQAAYTKAQMAAAPFASQLAAHAQSGIVVMGTGPAGVQGYNAALNFIRLGVGRVYWYRGGEEAWAAHKILPNQGHGP
jgi:DNA-binding winged helix-turn-helix (wHTH) protein/TolB-like protein